MEDDKLIDVICTSNVITHEYLGKRVVTRLKVGNIYKCHYNMQYSGEYKHYMHGIRFYEECNETILFSDYLFITLTEHRNNQIDSIFN